MGNPPTPRPAQVPDGPPVPSTAGGRRQSLAVLSCRGHRRGGHRAAGTPVPARRPLTWGSGGSGPGFERPGALALAAFLGECPRGDAEPAGVDVGLEGVVAQ